MQEIGKKTPGSLYDYRVFKEESFKLAVYDVLIRRAIVFACL